MGDAGQARLKISSTSTNSGWATSWRSSSKALVAEQMLDIAPGAGEEIVDAKEPGSRPQAAARTNGPLGTLTRRSTCIFPSIHAVGPGAQHPKLWNGLLRKEEDVVVPDELKDRLNEKAVSAAVSGETKLLAMNRMRSADPRNAQICDSSRQERY